MRGRLEAFTTSICRAPWCLRDRKVDGTGSVGRPQKLRVEDGSGGWHLPVTCHARCSMAPVPLPPPPYCWGPEQAVRTAGTGRPGAPSPTRPAAAPPCGAATASCRTPSLAGRDPARPAAGALGMRVSGGSGQAGGSRAHATEQRAPALNVLRRVSIHAGACQPTAPAHASIPRPPPPPHTHTHTHTP
jgi:hypothetical protein